MQEVLRLGATHPVFSKGKYDGRFGGAIQCSGRSALDPHQAIRARLESAYRRRASADFFEHMCTISELIVTRG
jgi:hypothetical protein